jgi:hypothetical protein
VSCQHPCHLRCVLGMCSFAPCAARPEVTADLGTARGEQQRRRLRQPEEQTRRVCCGASSQLPSTGAAMVALVAVRSMYSMHSVLLQAAGIVVSCNTVHPLGSPLLRGSVSAMA